MAVVVALCLAISAGLGPGPTTVGAAVRAEPGAVMLPDERLTLQAVVADLRGTGAPDLVRIVADGSRGRVVLEVWRERGHVWERVGEDVEVIPAVDAGFRGAVVFGGAPTRLIVRKVADAERVTLVRQPHFRPPGSDPLCCMQLSDVVVDEGGVELVTVGSDHESVDALLALDLDGDGIDELLASRSLPPLGRTSYPSQALVFRWQGARFGPPTLTELNIGSGDTPFVLGETDGRPGEEAGVITTAARSVLYRLTLDAGDRIRAENSGLAVRDAIAVPTGDGPGIAVIAPAAGLQLSAWASGAPIGEPLGSQPITRGRILGPVQYAGVSALLVEEANGAPLRAFAVPDLAEVHDPALELDDGSGPPPIPVRAFRGPLPGGELDGGPAVIVDGWMLRQRAGAEPAATVAFGGAMPIGFAGSEGGWMAIAHGLAPGAATDPDGGRLAGTPPATGSVSLAPIGAVMSVEPDGAFAPQVFGAVRLDGDGTLGVASEGFRLVIEAPPGSRLHAGVSATSVGLGLHHVPDSGRIEIRIPLSRAMPPDGGGRAFLGLVTPAGATYITSLDVLPLTGPPPLSGATSTPFGSSTVRVEGQTAPYATVAVEGQPVSVDASGRFVASVDLPPWPSSVEVVATDPLGNVARTELSGIGLLDYRALPWIPISIGLVLLAGAILFVRVPPRRGVAARRVEDTGLFEELDPDERFPQHGSR